MHPPRVNNGTKCHLTAFYAKELHKRQENTVSTPYGPQSAPDVVFLRNTGFALLAFTLAAGAISVVGVLKTSETSIMAQSAASAAPADVSLLHQADDSLLQQMERNIFQWEMLQAHYVNPKSI
jgi:hypothetical protein